MREEGREALWASRIREQASSGMSVEAYCREHRLSRPSFYRWRRRLDSAGDGTAVDGFLEVLVDEGRVSVESGVCLRTDGWLEIELRRGFDAGTLRQVLSVVREVCSCSR